VVDLWRQLFTESVLELEARLFRAAFFYAGSSQSDCPAAAGVGWRDGALEAHRLLRALRAPWRSGPLQQAARVKGSHGGLPSLDE